MKPIYRVLLCIILGFTAIIAGGMFVSPVKHTKAKNGYVIPKDGARPDPSRMDADYMADFVAEAPFYAGAFTGLLLLGYATLTTMRSYRDRNATKCGT